MTKVTASERLIKTSSEGSETFTLEMIFFLSRKTVVDLEIELAKFVHGMRPTER